MRPRPRPPLLYNPMPSCLPTPRPGSAPLLAGPNQVPIVRYARAAEDGGPGPDPRNTAVQLDSGCLPKRGSRQRQRETIWPADRFG